MRVNDQSLNGTAGLQSGQTPSASPADQPGSTSESQTMGPTGPDAAEISSLAGKLSQALAAQATGRTQQVQKLASDYAAGRYSADAQAASRSIIQEALTRKDA